MPSLTGLYLAQSSIFQGNIQNISLESANFRNEEIRGRDSVGRKSPSGVQGWGLGKVPEGSSPQKGQAQELVSYCLGLINIAFRNTVKDESLRKCVMLF